MKKIIGIVPASNDLFNTDFVYEDKYCISNNYITRIKESGGIPIGVLPEGIYIDDEDLEIYDRWWKNTSLPYTSDRLCYKK